jgi:DNA polymerase-3 subunit epsilon
MYAVIDVETTGLSPKRNKIIEIAIILFDGNHITEEFHTLINPERTIPRNITRITGITNEMVREKPKFWEVARQIVELTHGKIFVAHNATFDYNFIRHEFLELGYKFVRDKLCTVKYSRKLIPGRNSYSLEKICKDERIVQNDKHRAYGDALATTNLLSHLLQIEAKNKSTDKEKDNLTSKIEKLPAKTGVYYFYDATGDIVYIGKSTNIKERVKSHFNSFSGNRSLRMLDQINDISFELTGSELVALLKESEEIKFYKPLFNKAQRRDINLSHIIQYTDDNGYINLNISKNQNKGDLVLSFDSKLTAKKFLEKLSRTYTLCRNLCGLENTTGPCFYYQIDLCSGVCINKETAESYNQRVLRAVEYFSFSHQNMFLVDRGRSEDEKSIIKIENGKYIGYGYIENALISENNPVLLHDVIRKSSDNKEVRRLINNYLHNHKNEAVIYF